MKFDQVVRWLARVFRTGLTPAALAVLLFFRPAMGADGVSSVTVQQIQALLEEKAARTPAQQKMDSQLLQAVRESRGQPMTAGVNLAPANVGTDGTGRIAVDVNVRSAATLDAVTGQIEALGGEIVFPSWAYRTIRARINLSQAEAVAALPDVTFLQPAVGHLHAQSARPVPAPADSFEARAARVKTRLADALRRPLTGTVNSQGDRTHRADDARSAYGTTGAGIRIGVLSDSYNALGTAPADVTSGNLPGPGNPLGHLTPVTVVQDFAGATDEGRAMLQIVHDLAPDAQLFFATADVSEAGFAANIVALRNAPNNCDIIIDDVFYFDEPVFQDGIVAQAVNTVTAAGALYFSSAGNEGSVVKGTSGYYEGDFNDAGSLVFTFPGGAKSGTIHNFGTLGSPVNGDIVTAVGFAYNLSWSDPAGASANDYDLFLVSSTGTVKGSSTNVQSGTQNPYEIVGAPALAAGDRLVVFKTAAAAVRAFSLNTLRGRLTVATTGQTHGHSSAAAAFSVAAAPAAAAFNGIAPVGPYPGPFTGASLLETFSSDGPRRVFYDAAGTALTPGNLLFGTNGGSVRAKPDITAADGVSTTLPGSSGLNPFYGTSAAAPHAGAIAGLVKSANPALTPAQIRTILTTTAVDVEVAGIDSLSGFGIVQAFQAVQAAAPTQAGVLLGGVVAAEGAFSNGNGAIDPGELGTLVVQLTNPTLASATAIQATLTTTTPGVTITQGVASYGTLAAGASATNGATPFMFGVGSSVPCGSLIAFSMTVSFGGGTSPEVLPFTVLVGKSPGVIAGTLGSPPPTGTGFTSTNGQQTGRITRNAVTSTCAAPKANPGLTAPTGSRQYDAYTFTNTSANSQCVTVTLAAANGIALYTAAYTAAGFVPASPATNYLADPGSSGNPQVYSFNVAPATAFTVVVHDINVTPASGSPYTLTVALAACASGPACTPVSITTASIASGVINVPYTQSFTSTGGSGAVTWSETGALPTGVTLTGNTLSGTPTVSGSFPISVTATDAAGCTPDTKPFTLTIAPSCPPPPPLVMTAPAFVGQGSPNRVASVVSIGGAVYAWTITNGTITSGQGTNQITFTAGTAGTPLTLNVTATVGVCPSGGGFANVTVLPIGSSVQFYPVMPCRSVDTRGAPGPSGGPALVAGGPDRAFTLAGACGIPADAAAVSANITVVSPGALGFLAIYRGDGVLPGTSNISFGVGQTRASAALLLLALDGTGGVKVRNASAGSVDLILDVNGYFQ